MWYAMENEQNMYALSERLIRAISNWHLCVPSVDDIEDLIDAGADVNRLHGTLLPLHCACMVSDNETLKLLLDKGARVNDADGYGRTALHYAAERDSVCTEMLIEHGANVNAGDANSNTALHWAAFKSNEPCVILLLKNGANVDAHDFNDDTPLSWAARKGSVSIIKLLLDYNACVNCKNLRGLTALHRIASVLASGLNTDADSDCMELLLRAVGQFDFRNENSELPADLARDNKLCETLLPLSQNVRPLENLCRFTIRKFLGQRYLPNVVPKLPLPRSIQELVLLKK
ncbi:ankyrin repeat and SOCS box protein 8-like [Mytilus trossulus]|uniref:ankyrin repeat and SOCS box protein 8-like n=1 Tax=Mytilus trossulus TaxID=6551 RepID=UPI0030079C14